MRLGPRDASRFRWAVRALGAFVAAMLVPGFVTPAGAAVLPTGGILPAVQQSINAAKAAATALQANGQAFAAEIQAIVAEAPNDPQAALTAIQDAVDAELGELESIALSQALSLASKVAAPLCSVIAGVTAAVPNLPYPPGYEVFGPLAAAVEKQDRNIANAIEQYYIDAFTKLLAPITLPPALAQAQGYVTLAQTLLGLLKINWHSTYYPPGGGTPLVRDTPAFLNLPMIVDVDGRTGLDLCVNFGLDLSTGGLTQSIARVPLSAAVLPIDIQGQFLGGVIAPGYEAKTSQAPIGFDSTLTMAGAPVSTSLLRPGGTFTQTHNLTTALQYRWGHTTPPASYQFRSGTAGGTGGSGTILNYTASSGSGRFSYETKLASLQLGIAHTPGAAFFEWCTSTKGFCSNEPASASATEKSSMHFVASEQVTVDQTSSAGATTCPGLAILGDAHLTGTRFFLGADTTANPGHAWIDTDGYPLSGCLATASTTGTIPTGFTAQDRLVSWGGAGSPAPATAKSGTVSCPTGTSITGGSAGLTFGLSRYLCAFAPANTTMPSITGQNYQGSEMTANKGTWTPSAPNLPTFTYQWERCDGGGGSCAPIAGATGTTYTGTAADLTHTLRVAVTATNLDGASTVRTAPTGIVTLPPAPVNATPPAITGIAGTGQTLTASNGVWNNAPSAFAFQWQLCDEDGTNCADIPGATGTTYVPSLADQGHSVRVVVTASNLGGTGDATSAAVLIPPPPVNLGLPVIRIGSTPVTGANVFEGDHLATTDGTWKYAGTFAYQWLRCDAAGANCAPIAGATTAAYAAAHDDIGSTLAVSVTTTNPDGSATVLALPTGQVLANALLPKAPKAVPDGPVLSAVASDHETTYVGGSFDTVGLVVGNGGAVPATPAAVSRNVSLAALVGGGTVNAVASDTAGGYFLGGTFTSVLGQPCVAVGHVTAAGALDPTYCRPALTGEVRALDYVKRNVTIGASVPVDVLVVGGSFATGDGHQNLMFLDNTGLASYPAVGDPGAAVNAIANDTSAGRPNFFVGGEFTNVGTVAAKRLALVTIGAPPVAGNPITLNASAYPGGVDCAGGTCTDPVIRAVAFVTASSLPNIVIGGTFDTVYGTGTNTNPVSRRNAASFAEVSSPNQVVGNWNPSPNGPIYAIAGPVTGSGTAAVYLAGDFTQVGTQTGYKGLAEWGLASGLTSLSPLLWSSNNSTTAGTTVNGAPNTVWKPQIEGGRVHALLSDTTTGVYAAGSFTSIGGVTRHRLAQLSLPGAAPVVLGAWDPNAGQTVRSLARFVPSSGPPTIFVGGAYRVLGGDTRKNVAELTPAGDLTAWTPTGTNGPVNALGLLSGVLFAGGSFTADGAGAARSKLAAFDTGSGATTAWNPGAGGDVAALAAAGDVVYAGGTFGLTALDAVSGAATGWNPDVDGSVSVIDLSGDTVYAGGSFGLTALDAVTGAAIGWSPDVDGSVFAIEASGDTVYAGGSFGLTAVDAVSGAATGFDPGADGAVRALLVVGSRLFAGGDFTTIGGVARSHAAQFDTNTGEVTGFLPEPDGTVRAATITPGGALGLFGSFLTLAGGVRTNGVAFYGG